MPGGARWPTVPAAAPRTLVDILESTVRAHPTAPALAAGDSPLDYRTLFAEVTAFAGRLRDMGIGPGDRVGVRVASGTAELYVAILAVLWAGAAYVPVDADDPDERAEMIWSEAGVRAVVGAGMSVRCPGVTAAGRRPGRPSPGDDAWIIFTSGTTGQPKGVAVTHRSAAALVDAEARLFLRAEPLGPGDRVLAGLSVGFDASCEEMWLAWRHGACLVPAPRSLVRAGTDLGPWLVDHGITAISTVPGLLALWPVASLDRVRLLIVGGEACPEELVDRLGAGREMWNTYGPTETAVVACAARLVPGEPVRIGRPLDGWEVAVVDAEGRPVPWGATGELVIAGVGTARYLDGVRDAEAFRTHPALPGQRVYRSGDLVRADPQGLAFVGRADDQVKIAGRRVELGEIDTALRALPGVRAAAAAVHSTAAAGQVLVGYVVPDESVADGRSRFDVAAARHHLRGRLPPPLVPRIAVIQELPTSTSGKIDRRALPWPLPPPAEAGVKDADLGGTTGWLAGHWRRLLAVPVTAGSDFFALGGSSLAAARLVSALRERFPDVSVTDVYRCPTLCALAERLDTLGQRHRADRVVRPTPRRAGVVQALVLVALFTVVGLRWLLALATLDNVTGPPPGIPRLSWWVVLGGWLALCSAPSRLGICAGVARLLTRGVRPGAYPRGCSVHLRLWAAERTVMTLGMPNLLGTPWATLFARAVGCTVGRDVALHALPPVTGLAAFGDGCAVEPEADITGWWLDGDVLHLGAVRIGADARVGTRAMLLPGALVEQRAHIAPGACVTGTVVPGQVWSGTPARPTGEVDGAVFRQHRERPTGRGWWPTAYATAALGFDILPLLALLPAFILFDSASGTGLTPGVLVQELPWAVPVGTLLTVLSYAALVAVIVRLAGAALTPGSHPVSGRVAWCAWVTSRLMDQARRLLFPLYASLLTPLWLRLCGAKVGHRAEVSTALTLPRLTSVERGAFLADDTLLAPYELHGPWLRLGRSAVGRRAFVGNSGIVGPGRALPDHALIGVLSDAPAHLDPGTSWLGRPGFSVPRRPDHVDPRRTFQPPMHLVVARAAIELCRAVPLLCGAVLADAVFLALEELVSAFGWTAAIALVGPLLLAGGVIASLVTTAAKWVLVGRFTPCQHPLWSSFVWRNELYDTFVETLASPWFGHHLVGTPLLNVWLRTLGAHIGRGVWCDSHWLPEPDLVRLGDGASVNRGCVLQTHLFHDRLMRVDAVQLRPGATLGPHSIALPGAVIGDGAAVGPSSLVMGGEHVPAGTRWLGNPVARWTPGAVARCAMRLPSADGGRQGSRQCRRGTRRLRSGAGSASR
ncbi:Pls/PosA family non-ribosomal peptide synthetase [Streptantibioticus ferralitis]|uniref:Amino acid adenylation domain-containing protein n=1 Tax=Streptantibioticus ferralitis TaxID=236510 RepID=A0ABT5YWF4_9ACTN|nr:Pls/PosA family non-ribosomal peptide synthetase [Streptantibioticus ferralitis]MDF2255180.1 amino acid adenylation domain-containing protein [Streptantibioticus ferralitis]